MRTIDHVIRLLILVITVVAQEDAVHEKTCVARDDGSTTCQQQQDSNNTDESDNNHNDKQVSCQDQNENCAFWANLNPSECDKNPNYMNVYCPKSCHVCDQDNDDDDEDYLDLGALQRQTVERANDVNAVMDMTYEYMNGLLKDPSYADVIHDCKNLHTDCILWALQGACDEHPRYMLKNCAPTCQSCDQIAYERRCPMDENVLPPDAWQAGDLNTMFERITTNQEFAKFSPQILSRPQTEQDSKQNDGPWLITLDDFLTPQECDRLIELGHEVGYERSYDVGQQNADGSFDRTFSEGRTSTTAWCKDSCFEDAVTQTVLDKIVNLTNIPQDNSEYLQLLKYGQGEFYKSHHDLNPFQAAHQPGVRMLTVFLYLNNVEEGGGTNFPKLDVTIKPKQGRVVIWPSVLDRNPSRKDVRMTHQALPVEKGIKYGANAWIHLRDFKGPISRNCQ